MQRSLSAIDRNQLRRDYRRVRAQTEALCESLEPEDMVVQSMPEVSPTKWHLAHVTWFFETLVLAAHQPGYRLFDDRYGRLFNSYYETLGKPHPRERRGLLTRPTVGEVLEYRRHVDAAMLELLEELPTQSMRDVTSLMTIGLHHEQQHQELMLMDILHVLAQNPLQPAYRSLDDSTGASDANSQSYWHEFAGGDTPIGADAEGFCYDNELPQHAVHLQPFEFASRLVTTEEYRAFMMDGGYRRPELWLADGWELVKREELNAPLYWERYGDSWRVMTLEGLRLILKEEPVRHINFYEADAYARWAGSRLPTEHEWEHAASSTAEDGPSQLFDLAWQWTSSPYSAYPGYRAFEGSLGEYNGKFMINQMVLRGGCSETPAGHARETYRNFYYPHQRWMFSGIRLAR